MTLEQQLIEVRHLMRKHILLGTVHGAAMTFRCMECGRNGADTPAGIYHEDTCRVAALMIAFGDTTVKRGDIPVAKAPDVSAVGMKADVDACFT